MPLARRLLSLLLGAAAAFLIAASVASAAPPPNDAPAGAGAFEPVTAENGHPHSLQAIAELAGATPDSGAPRCLGPGSFARTVWYLIPAAQIPQELTVEGSGRTLAVVDLAAYVQREGATTLGTPEPNACSGAGAGGSDAAQEPTSAVTLRVPARRAVLIQVGRRGPVRSADDERAVLSLEMRPLADQAPPPGDSASRFNTPFARVGVATLAPLAGATITDEDPAQPPCPSLGSVWRRFVPSGAGPRLISVSGSVSTLTVFAGGRPTGGNVLDCVNRARSGPLQMLVQVRRRLPIWIRIGTDRPAPGARARLLVQAVGPRELVVDGGAGGSDPTSGGPGGGFPPGCLRTVIERARIGGPRFHATATGLDRRPVVALTVAVSGAIVCDAQFTLAGPGGHVYASGRAIALLGRRVMRLDRVRRLVPGRYRLRVSGLSQLGRRVAVRGGVAGVIAR